MANPTMLPPRHLWPIGFGFRPTEEELYYYLKNKMLGEEFLVRCIREVDLYNFEPWELPQLSVLESDNHEWFFFRAQPFNGNRPKTKRTTTTGYWKSTGEDRKIKARGKNKVIGTRKILVFHRGKSPSGVKTNWIIHEYHLQPDADIDYQSSFVICRLKENAEEKCDEDEQKNNCVASRGKEKITERAIQEVPNETIANGRSVFEQNFHPPCYSEHAPVLINFQPDNGYGEVNRQLVPPGVTESEVGLTEWLNSALLDEDEVTSKVWNNSSNEANLQSPCYFNRGPSLMDSHPSNGDDGEINWRLMQPGASELVNSIFVDDEMYYEITSNICKNSYDKDEWDSMVLELSPDPVNDAAFGWQNNQFFPNWSHEHPGSSEQYRSIPTIKESRRSPLTVKRLPYKVGKESGHFQECSGNSSVLSGEGGAQKCSISMVTDGSAHRARTIKVQHQQECNDIVPYRSGPTRVLLKKGEGSGKAISQDKVRTYENRMRVVRPPQSSVAYCGNEQKGERGNNADKRWMPCYGSTDKKGNGVWFLCCLLCCLLCCTVE